MSHPETETLIKPEEAEAAGAHAAPIAIVLSLTKGGGVPSTVLGTNVRAASREGDTFLCQGVVVREPVVFGQEMVLVEATALLLGFYSAGYDDDHAPILCAAYGKPMPHRSWRVVVGQTFKAYVIDGPAVHYEGMTLTIVSELDRKTP